MQLKKLNAALALPILFSIPVVLFAFRTPKKDISGINEKGLVLNVVSVNEKNNKVEDAVIINKMGATVEGASEIDNSVSLASDEVKIAATLAKFE